MTRILRVACCAVIGAVCCVSVITVLAQERADDPFGGIGPAAGAETPAAPLAAEAAVSKVESTAEDGPHRFNFCHCPSHGSQLAVARIENALRGPLNSNGLDFADTPLEEVVNFLQDEYGIPIQIDEAALEATGLDSSEPITVNLHKVSLGSALRLMFKKLQLTYIIQDEVLMITTPDEAESNLMTCVYDARPFLDAVNDESVKSLVDTIVSCVHKETWSQNGKGEAEIRSLKPALLVISQTRQAHDEIARLLSAIQKMRAKTAAEGETDAD
jgi:hypothetical protein